MGEIKVNYIVKKEYIIPALSAVLTSIFPALFLYFQNSDEVALLDAIPVICIYALLGIVLFYIILAVVKSPDTAGIIASLFLFVLVNYRLLENALRFLFHSLRYWHCVVIIPVLVGHIAFLIKRHLPKQLENDVVKLICVVFGALIALNTVIGVPGIINKIGLKRSAETDNSQTSALKVSNGDQAPNIYVFIFDEYANFPQMKEYYNYDNEPLMDFLTKNNFSISYTTHNESYMTPTVTTNLVNLDYLVTDQMSLSEREAIRQDGKLFSLMREHGYTVDILESFDFFGGRMPEGTSASKEASTMDGETIRDLCFKQTILYPFWSTDHSEFVENAFEISEYLSDPASLPDGNTFTLVYINLPHTPFVVDENGKSVPIRQSLNWKDKQYYLGQFKYTTKLMLKMLQNIVDNDPDSIIWVQSDHGARGGEQEGFRAIFPDDVKTNPLNAIYVRGESSLPIEGLSSVNTLRALLNYLWDEDYKMIPLPSAQDEDK